eukprot:scaffold29924_cov18-Tisochrysis_lutea.AAC.2
MSTGTEISHGHSGTVDEMPLVPTSMTARSVCQVHVIATEINVPQNFKKKERGGKTIHARSGRVHRFPK